MAQPRTVRGVEDELADLADEIDGLAGALRGCYARRNVLYARGLMLGMRQTDIAAAAASTPEAVAKALKKLRASGG